MSLSCQTLVKSTAASSVVLFGAGVTLLNVGYVYSQKDVEIVGIALLVISSLGIVLSLLYLCVPSLDRPPLGATRYV